MKEWFLIDNIVYDQIANKISGKCIYGPYYGEVEIYLQPFICTKKLQSGLTIRALCGPGMTMSLPPQLMGCEQIQIIKWN